jgi:HlyD family secretion protein
MRKNRLLCLFTVLLVIMSLSACKGGNDKKSQAKQSTQIFTVSKKPSESSFYYSGIIEPLVTTVVTAPNEGTVKKLSFSYGQAVKKGALLFTIKSDQFQQSLSDAVTKFLTAKSSYSQSQSAYQSSELLYKNGLVPRDQYQSTQQSYYSSNLSYLQAKRDLQKILLNHKSIKLDVSKLSLQHIKNLSVLQTDSNTQFISVEAPVSGIALLPDIGPSFGGDSSGSGGDKGPIKPGSSLKKGQQVLAIGTLNGATININIDEVTVNEIKKGLPAYITSVGFPGISLKGKVTEVGSQAKSDQTGLPVFPVKVIVSSLPKAARAVVRVGMSSKVKIVIKHKAKMLIPIGAVQQKKDGNFVKLKTAGGIKLQKIVTGQTTLNNVEVDKGLKPGDKIVVPN